jgi:hypothetical protein
MSAVARPEPGSEMRTAVRAPWAAGAFSVALTFVIIAVEAGWLGLLGFLFVAHLR